jgi:hypothetical protein
MLFVERMVHSRQFLLEVVDVAEQGGQRILCHWAARPSEDILDVLFGHRIDVGDLLRDLITGAAGV